MDGLSRTEHAARFLDILYAEDFDDPVPAEATLPQAPPPAPTFTEVERDQACADAIATARQAWESAAAQRRTDLAALLSERLAQAAAEARAVGLEAAEATAGAILSALLALLPDAAVAHGPAEAASLARRLLPMLAAEPAITVRVHADDVAALRQELADIIDEHSGAITISAAAVERGDLRVLWQNGSLKRDTRAIMQTMRDALAELGLSATAAKSPKRSLAHAE